MADHQPIFRFGHSVAAAGPVHLLNWYSQHRFNQIPPTGLVLPSSPVTFELWATPPPGKAKWRTAGGSWRTIDDVADGTIMDAKVAAGAGISLAKLATNPLARSNHTGTQPSSTISDLAAVVKAYRLDEFAAPGGYRWTNLGAPVNPNDGARLAESLDATGFVLNADALAEIEAAVPAGSAAGERYAAPSWPPSTANTDPHPTATPARLALAGPTNSTPTPLRLFGRRFVKPMITTNGTSGRSLVSSKMIKNQGSPCRRSLPSPARSRQPRASTRPDIWVS
ncbi:hypothetical protein [Nonomuraea sp. NPDC049784]|uniref:hypothetical protein n=1 Tax=Nonomuraea sp. NPDC049784 TaxID=3154361 RepID=UPI0033C3FEA6